MKYDSKLIGRRMCPFSDSNWNKFHEKKDNVVHWLEAQPGITQIYVWCQKALNLQEMPLRENGRELGEAGRAMSLWCRPAQEWRSKGRKAATKHVRLQCTKRKVQQGCWVHSSHQSPKEWACLGITAALNYWLWAAHGKHGLNSNMQMNFRTQEGALGQLLLAVGKISERWILWPLYLVSASVKIGQNPCLLIL